MASEALQNQVLIDQMFARALAPVSTGLEQQRQAAEDRAKYQRALQARQAELAQEQAFRAQQSQLAIEANRQMALDQQKAIGARQVAEMEYNRMYKELGLLESSNLFTPDELVEFRKNPAAREKAVAEVMTRRTDRDTKTIETLDTRYRQAGNEVMAALASTPQAMPPAAVAAWLQTLPEEARNVIYRQIQSNPKFQQQGLSPQDLNEILTENKGLFSSGAFGLSRDERTETALSFMTALNQSGMLQGKASLGVQNAIEKMRTIKGMQDTLFKSNPDAVTNWMNAQLDKDQAAAAKTLQALQPVTVPTAPDVAPVADFNAPPVVPVDTGANYGGALGWLGRTAQGVEQKLQSAPASARALGTNIVSGAARAVGGEKLAQQVTPGFMDYLRSLSPAPMPMSSTAASFGQYAPPVAEPPPVVPISPNDPAYWNFPPVVPLQ